jgi:hypothetical protein
MGVEGRDIVLAVVGLVSMCRRRELGSCWGGWFPDIP